MTNFRLLMIGAMYENGGNVSHRFFDGHPQLYVYPFESQLGTRLTIDALSSTFPVKYRWPVFVLDGTPEDDYRSIIDEECKVRSRTPHVSKFRHRPFDLLDDERRDIYVADIARSGRSRVNNVSAFFRATFEAWRDFDRSGQESVYVGYSPIITVDADKVLDDFPDAHFLHVVRNPWSAYADTKKRPVPLSLPDYMLGWTLNQHYALLFRELYPGRFHIVRTEDVVADPVSTLGPTCERLGLDVPDSLRTPSWNGKPLDEVYPWGTIRSPTSDANRKAAAELAESEQKEIALRAWQYLEVFDYAEFLTEAGAAAR